MMKQLVLLTALLAAPVLADPLPALEVPFAKVKPAMDANPTDFAWALAAKIPSMTSSLVTDGPQPVVKPTEVRALWDEDYIYVRFIATDDEVFTPFKERDAFHYQGDVAEIFFDAIGDGRFFYELQLSPRGGILDQYVAITTDPRSDEHGKFLPEVRNFNYWANLSWNCDGLLTGSRILEDRGKVTGWIAEFALPAKVMMRRAGLTKFSPGTVRANFLRYDWVPKAGSTERDLLAQNWSTVLYGNPHQSPARMGFLKLQPAPPAP